MTCMPYSPLRRDICSLGTTTGTASDLEARPWVKKHIPAPPSGALRDPS